MQAFEAKLPWAGLNLRLELDMAPGQAASWTQSLPRWLRQVGGSAGEQVPAGGAVMHLALASQRCGLEVGPENLRSSMRWASATQAELTATAGTCTARWEGERLVGGEGEIFVGHPALGLQSIASALLVLGLQARGVLCVHASAVRVGEGGYLLLGVSGAGKTTTARRLGREGLQRLSDDLVALRLRGDRPRLYPLPFERRGRPISGPPYAGLPLLGAAWVIKGAESLFVTREPSPWQTWPEAFVQLAPSPAWAAPWASDLSALDAIPVHRWHIPPRGPLTATLLPLLNADPPGRAEAPYSPGRASVGSVSDEPEPPAPEPKSGPSAATPERRWRRAPEVAWRRTGELVVLVSPHSTRVLTLNPVAAHIWQRLEELPLDGLAAELADLFEVSPERASSDLDAFVYRLAERGLLVEGAA